MAAKSRLPLNVQITDSTYFVTKPWTFWFTFVNAAIINLFGLNQVWSNQTANRAIGNVYTNNGPAPIMFSVEISSTITSNFNFDITVDGLVTGQISHNASAGDKFTLQSIVPPGQTYEVQGSNITLTSWMELS